MNNLIIETSNLCKCYGVNMVVSHVNIHVQKGSIYGLLGRNGAGKTSIMKMMLGLTPITDGNITMFGMQFPANKAEILRRVGVMIETPGFYPNLTATENLQILSSLRDVTDKNAIQKSLELVGLPYKDKKMFSEYSLGMKQRLGIAASIVHDKKRSKISPNTIRRSAFALSYYLNYMDENQLHLDDIYQMKYAEQHEHFTEFLIWLKAGEHSREEYSKLPNNETCNAYLKEVFRFYTFMERENGQSESLKVLSDAQTIVRNSIGVRRVLNRKSFHGYLKEKGHQGKTIEQDKIVSLLQECANCRDQVLLLLLAETGFRIGELLGVRYMEDIDYKNHMIYVNFREDNENGARAKNAEFRRAKVSDATFDILMFYIEDYKELIMKQEYLFINISGDYVGKPFKVSGVYAMLRRLESKTGIKASPHRLRHYFANARRKDGWKLELISQALGHRSIETTMKYLNITDEELIQVSDEFYNKHQAMYGIQNLL